MLRIESANSRKGFAESRRLMWAYARQANISYFYLLCHEKALYAIYDEDVFCGCAVRGSRKGSSCVLCLFSQAAYCKEDSRASVTELLTKTLPSAPGLIDFAQVAEAPRPEALRPLRQT